MRARRLPLFRYLLAAAIVLAVGLGWWSASGSLRPASRGAGETGESVLAGYRVLVDAKPIAQIADNLSGLAYDGERGHLWAVVNNPEELIALGLDGEVMARYPLDGFKDVEGVAYLGDGMLVVAEEHHNALVVIGVPDQPRRLSRDAKGALKLPIPGRDNRGFEGLGYDGRHDRLYVVKEHTPLGLYEVRGLKASLEGKFDLEIIDRTDWIPGRRILADLSSAAFHEAENRLMLLSHESRAIVELNDRGRRIAMHPLTRTFAGLGAPVIQAEGLALDDRGRLYLVSEPNLFYAFAPGDTGTTPLQAR